ncbi:replication initiation protein [Corynebacterium belfantii]|uniref:replication initiation protein n=1 Tax=Corynebacterium belfantii TaxID=2014537 RepID=UPI0018D36364|nr:replication initiation protein [Corynebacterium belfantii]
MTAPTDLPDGRFEQLWLPLWPLASDNLREGIYRTSRHKALGKRYAEANPDAISNLLVVDIDHEDALLRAMWNRAQWRPNQWLKTLPTATHTPSGHLKCPGFCS